MNVSATARLGAATLLLGIGLTAVFEVPHIALWKPAVGATELGHLVAIAAILVALPARKTRRARLAGGMALLAFAMLLSPVLRAIPVAVALPAELEAAFGPTTPHPPARSHPLTPGGLLRVASPPVTMQTHTYREIDGQTLALDLYSGPDADHPRPLVVVIHGGSWKSGDRTQLPGINRYLAGRGFAVASISYRFAPQAIFPDQREDTLAAVDWLTENAETLNLDPDRVALLGRSAGGQLALSAGALSGRTNIRGIIAYYAPSDMNWAWQDTSSLLDTRTTLGDYLGGTPQEVPETFTAASPLNFITPSTPPVLSIHGDRDELVSPEHSRRLDAALTQAGVPHLSLTLPASTHGCDAFMVGPCGQISTYAIERFLSAVMQ